MKTMMLLAALACGCTMYAPVREYNLYLNQ